MKKFVGQAHGSGCGMGEDVTLCVEAIDKTQARNMMETIMASRYPSSDVDSDSVREATDEECRTLPIDEPEDPA